ncbi:hypothetical protein BGZ57DRAFT_942082 [Hyaloscypha finlandica]|nr:hypothetical protein BGZ57DRAFT_942082 [Hyaloscypha finlandica]
MPKKRFTPQYSKPQSTVHPSLQSPATASSTSSTNSNDATPMVNDLISTLRKSQVNPSSAAAPSIATGKTLPPQIRHLLSQPETPAPKPRARDRRRFDANGNRIPAGPAPPRSWLQSQNASSSSLTARREGRVFPARIDDLPGLGEAGGVKGNKLQDMCLRAMARDWEFIQEYERNNLADLPVAIRILLLSYIAAYGPDEGVGFGGLKSLLLHPASENEGDNWDEIGEEGQAQNEGFFRLDLSGTIGRSVSFKQLIELVQKPSPATEDHSEFDLSWEDSLTRGLSSPIPHLTHLSLSHPPHSISWPRFLACSRHIPTLTHLSLAFWPVPSLTPNSKTAVVTSRFDKDIQYGGTGFYSHSLDNDFREASDVLRRLAGRLYGLEYLDLTGCAEWLRALRWTGDVGEGGGIDWGGQWVKLHILKLFSGVELNEEKREAHGSRFLKMIWHGMMSYGEVRGCRRERERRWMR